MSGDESPASDESQGLDKVAFVPSPSMRLQPRKSQRIIQDYSTLLEDEPEDDDDRIKFTNRYSEIITRAGKCVGHGAEEGMFPEEWDAQLLIDAGRASTGHRIMVFTPVFLKILLQDERELDQAFKYILLKMHELTAADGVGDEKFIFVYCHSGMDWTPSPLAHRLRIAYDMLPPSYAQHLEALYIVHATTFFRLALGTYSAFLSSSFWSKVQYVSTLQELIEELHPDAEDVADRNSLRRHFPQLVHREDCLLRGVAPPLTFGVPLRRLCDGFGVDFTDKTTGRHYPRLPPALVFLCEALERHAADESFSYMFSADSTVTYDLVGTLDEGQALDPDTNCPALWCTLKLFVDFLPEPLLGDETFSHIQQGKQEAQLKFLGKLLHSLSPDTAYAALYLASFLHTMCETVRLASSTRKHEEGITSATAAEVFTPGFVRPRKMTEVEQKLMPACVSLIKTFIDHAEDPNLWIGD